MENKLPTMPNLGANPVSSPGLDVEKSTPSFGEDKTLDVPAHDEQNASVLQKPATPDLHSPEISSIIKLSELSKNGIQVVATRKGFYNQNRIREGEVFRIQSFEDIGEWMKCTDPDLEKERVKFFKEKRRKDN